MGITGIRIEVPCSVLCGVVLFFDQNLTAQCTSQSKFRSDVHGLLCLLHQLLSLLSEQEHAFTDYKLRPVVMPVTILVSSDVCAGMLPWCPASMARLLAWHGRPFTTSSWRHPASHTCAAAVHCPSKERGHRVRSHRVSWPAACQSMHPGLTDASGTDTVSGIRP